MRDATHREQVERWALRCKKDMNACLSEIAPFINAQVEMANDFYKRLARTKGGKGKIRMLKHGVPKQPHIKPFDWGKGTENTGRDVDKIAYRP